jgi:hypothetical protein
LANFGPAKTITAAQIMSQQAGDFNPLLIFMCAIRVKSGTRTFAASIFGANAHSPPKLATIGWRG